MTNTWTESTLQQLIADEVQNITNHSHNYRYNQLQTPHKPPTTTQSFNQPQLTSATTITRTTGSQHHQTELTPNLFNWQSSSLVAPKKLR